MRKWIDGLMYYWGYRRYNPLVVDPTLHEKLIKLLDPTKMTDEEKAAIWTLLKYMKKLEQTP